MNELQPLIDAGLKVGANPPDSVEAMIQTYRTGQYPDPFIPYYDVRKPEQHPTYNVPTHYRLDSDTPLDATMCELYRNIETEEWAIRAWECIPGPCKDDFLCIVPSLSAAVTVVHNFYFGASIVIDGWTIPLHRHPELDLSKVRAMIARAQRVSQSAFERIEQQRWEQITLGNEPGGWDDIIRRTFLTFSHSVDATVTLRLRRDLQEGFIVHKESTV